MSPRIDELIDAVTPELLEDEETREHVQDEARIEAPAPAERDEAPAEEEDRGVVIVHLVDWDEFVSDLLGDDHGN